MATTIKEIMSLYENKLSDLKEVLEHLPDDRVLVAQVSKLHGMESFLLKDFILNESKIELSQKDANELYMLLGFLKYFGVNDLVNAIYSSKKFDTAENLVFNAGKVDHTSQASFTQTYHLINKDELNEINNYNWIIEVPVSKIRGIKAVMGKMVLKDWDFYSKKIGEKNKEALNDIKVLKNEDLESIDSNYYERTENVVVSKEFILAKDVFEIYARQQKNLKKLFSYSLNKKLKSFYNEGLNIKLKKDVFDHETEIESINEISYLLNSYFEKIDFENLPENFDLYYDIEKKIPTYNIKSREIVYPIAFLNDDNYEKFLKYQNKFFKNEKSFGLSIKKIFQPIFLAEENEVLEFNSYHSKICMDYKKDKEKIILRHIKYLINRIDSDPNCLTEITKDIYDLLLKTNVNDLSDKQKDSYEKIVQYMKSDNIEAKHVFPNVSMLRYDSAFAIQNNFKINSLNRNFLYLETYLEKPLDKTSDFIQSIKLIKVSANESLINFIFKKNDLSVDIKDGIIFKLLDSFSYEYTGTETLDVERALREVDLFTKMKLQDKNEIKLNRKKI